MVGGAEFVFPLACDCPRLFEGRRVDSLPEHTLQMKGVLMENLKLPLPTELEDMWHARTVSKPAAIRSQWVECRAFFPGIQRGQSINGEASWTVR